jgi:hypothetical protein
MTSSGELAGTAAGSSGASRPSRSVKWPPNKVVKSLRPRDPAPGPRRTSTISEWCCYSRPPDATELVNIQPSTVKRHLADLRARSGLTTEQLIYAGRAEGWLVVPSLESG